MQLVGALFVIVAVAVIATGVAEAVHVRRHPSSSLAQQYRNRVRFPREIAKPLAIVAVVGLGVMAAIVGCFSLVARDRISDVSSDPDSRNVAGQCFALKGDVAMFRWEDTGEVAVDVHDHGPLMHRIPGGTEFVVERVTKKTSFEFVTRNVQTHLPTYSSEVVDVTSFFNGAHGSKGLIVPDRAWLKRCDEVDPARHASPPNSTQQLSRPGAGPAAELP